MRWTGWTAPARALAGILLAAAVAVPAFVSAPGDGPEPGAPAPGPASLASRIEAQIHARVPGLEASARRVLGHTILAEAHAARIDPLLVLALIEVESGWDPSAASPGGARGLMQLREATLRRELERAGLTLTDPDEPVGNVRGGIRYLRRLLDAFGRQEIALMAYNAGPNRILGYLREGGVPARFEEYPRRVEAEVRRLRRSFGVERAPQVAQARPIREPQ